MTWRAGGLSIKSIVLGQGDALWAKCLLHNLTTRIQVPKKPGKRVSVTLGLRRGDVRQREENLQKLRGSGNLVYIVWTRDCLKPGPCRTGTWSCNLTSPQVTQVPVVCLHIQARNATLYTVGITQPEAVHREAYLTEKVLLPDHRASPRPLHFSQTTVLLPDHCASLRLLSFSQITLLLPDRCAPLPGHSCWLWPSRSVLMNCPP